MTRRMGQTLLMITLFGLLISTFLIRYELAYPGLSSLFGWFEPDTSQAGWATDPAQSGLGIASANDAYQLTVSAHHIMGLALCWLIVIYATRTANSVTPSRHVRRLSVLMTVLFCLSIIVQLALLLDPFFALSFGALAGQPYDILNSTVYPAAETLVFLDTVQLPLIAWATITASALMISQSLAERRAAWAIVAFATVLFLFDTQQLLAEEPEITSISGIASGALWLLALCAFVQSDGDRRGNIYLILGSITVFSGLIYTDFSSEQSPALLDDTMWVIMRTHASLLALTLFTGFAVLDIRLAPNLPRPLVWSHALALCIAAATAILPLGELGKSGMPLRYTDYPQAFAQLNLTASIGGFSLIALIILGAFLMFRHRQRADPAPQPPRASGHTIAILSHQKT